MNAEQCNIVYERSRELMLQHPHFGFDIDKCPACGIEHGTIVGEGEVEGQRWVMKCKRCETEMQVITEDAMVRYIDIISSILGHNDLLARGAFS
jgi:transposase-like protein